MLLKIRTHVHIRVHILRVNFQVSNQSDRVDTDAQIVQHRGKRAAFFARKKKDLHEKNREEKVFRVYNPNTVSLKGKEKKVLHKTISKSIHHGEFIRRVARTNLEQYA